MAEEEQGYLTLLDRLLQEKTEISCRDDVRVRSIFAPLPLRFDMAQNFPILVSKRVHFQAVKEELLWFLRGETNSETLNERGVKIWNWNGSRDFLDKRGLTERRVGDLGPIYGFQWRHFGAQYQGCDVDYTGQGCDQIKDVLNKIVHDPTSRRILMSAWQPCDLHAVALPPCHVMCQFHVRDGRLSAQVYQRSADVALGVPFNISSYALLTHMIAHVTGLQPGTLTLVIGDAHLYSDHTEMAKLQLERRSALCHNTSKLVIKTMGNTESTAKSVNLLSQLLAIRSEDIELLNYVHASPIRYPLVC